MREKMRKVVSFVCFFLGTLVVCVLFVCESGKLHLQKRKGYEPEWRKHTNTHRETTTTTTSSPCAQVIKGHTSPSLFSLLCGRVYGFFMPLVVCVLVHTSVSGPHNFYTFFFFTWRQGIRILHVWIKLGGILLVNYAFNHLSLQSHLWCNGKR